MGVLEDMKKAVNLSLVWNWDIKEGTFQVVPTCSFLEISNKVAVFTRGFMNWTTMPKYISLHEV